MRENAHDLVYLDTQRYMSLANLKAFYWGIIIIPIMMVVLGIATINTNGVSWKALFPLISITIWSFLYWIFVLKIQRKKTNKTFELRFLVNGISGLLVSSLFWILYTSFSLFANNPIVGLDFSLWILFFYLFFSALYIGLIVFGVHKGIFKRLKEKSQTPKALTFSAFFAAILPITGVLGMYTSKTLRHYASIGVQNFVGTIACVLIIFIPIFAHINFVQYFYCKKYEILCDEYGNATSPWLEPHTKGRENKAKFKNETCENTVVSDSRPSKKNIPLIIKILIGIIIVPIIFSIIVFFVFFIKGFIQGIS